jgi:hypothetical protein
MGFIKRDFKRRSGFRDAKLIVIATEGQKTETQYFEDFKDHYQSKRIHVEVLRRNSSASSPRHVLSELAKFKSEYKLTGDDELWMVIDLDQWTEAHLSEVASHCIQKSFHLAVSNPCFEVWLLLHVKDPAEYASGELTVFCNKTDLIKELRRILGSYNSANIDSKRFLPHVPEAIERARLLDSTPDTRWPTACGTRVYLLAEKILAIK